MKTEQETKILIVDDSRTIRRMIAKSLANIHRTTFEEAENGLEAIERLVLGPVSLMVLDLNMPEMHGIEVLKFVRSRPAYKSMPVVVLTTRGDDVSQADALAAGASLYLTKPFSPQELENKVRQLLT
ncbi:MAG TPA: response regulator [Pyrinomonadaceae bacterium]|nr:response regulator [Pyrinomonadaceae bacterium]